MFLLNSRILLVRFSSESIVTCARAPHNSNFIQQGPVLRQVLVSFHCPSKVLNTQSSEPILFPEVTDLICRIPLSTLFYRPEAANLGDLMRLWVRPDVIGSPYSDFQGSL